MYEPQPSDADMSTAETTDSKSSKKINFFATEVDDHVYELQPTDPVMSTADATDSKPQKKKGFLGKVKSVLP